MDTDELINILHGYEDGSIPLADVIDAVLRWLAAVQRNP